MGQPLKLHDNLIVSRIIEAISKGHTKDMAAHYAGIDPSVKGRGINARIMCRHIFCVAF